MPNLWQLYLPMAFNGLIGPYHVEETTTVPQKIVYVYQILVMRVSKQNPECLGRYQGRFLVIETNYHFLLYLKLEQKTLK